MNKYIHLVQLFMYEMPKSLRAVLYFSLLTWLFYGYKQVEGYINPVVVDFVIEEVEQVPEGTRIAGTMYKTRDCTFEEVLAYSGTNLVDVNFVDVRNVVSRVEGSQSWGWWIVIPAVNNFTLYSRHMCWTGPVLTKLYEGDIPHVD